MLLAGFQVTEEQMRRDLSQEKFGEYKILHIQLRELMRSSWDSIPDGSSLSAPRYSRFDEGQKRPSCFLRQNLFRLVGHTQSRNTDWDRYKHSLVRVEGQMS